MKQYIMRYSIANPTSLCNVAPSRLASGFTLLKALAIGAKQYTLKVENMKKDIRMGIIE